MRGSEREECVEFIPLSEWEIATLTYTPLDGVTCLYIKVAMTASSWYICDLVWRFFALSCSMPCHSQVWIYRLELDWPFQKQSICCFDQCLTEEIVHSLTSKVSHQLGDTFPDIVYKAKQCLRTATMEFCWKHWHPSTAGMSVGSRDKIYFILVLYKHKPWRIHDTRKGHTLTLKQGSLPTHFARAWKNGMTCWWLH